MTQIAISPAPQPVPQPPASSSADQTDSGSQDFASTLDNTINQQAEQGKNPPDGAEYKEGGAGNKNNQAESKSPMEGSEELPAGLMLVAAHHLPVKDAAVMQEGSGEVMADKVPLNKPLGKPNAPSLPSELPVQTNEITSGDKENTVNQTRAASIMARKIEQIINQSDEQARAAIKIEPQASQPAVVPANQPAIKVAGSETQEAAVPVAGTLNKATESEQTPKTARIRLDALTGPQEDNLKTVVKSQNNQQANQQALTDNNAVSQGFSTGSSPSSSEQVNNFAQVMNNQVSETAQSSHHSAVKTDSALPANIRETEVMDQVIQRFRVNPRLETAKITMQLSPAELGELKIDVLVKGDSIKASIIAQNQQAQEIIEKNMVKLRTVLEEQGFAIDELVVSGDRENNQSFSPFQQSFSQTGNFDKSDNTNISFELPIDEIEQSIGEQQNAASLNLII